MLVAQMAESTPYLTHLREEHNHFSGLLPAFELSAGPARVARMERIIAALARAVHAEEAFEGEAHQVVGEQAGTPQFTVRLRP